jgi:hypothetical protein
MGQFSMSGVSSRRRGRAQGQIETLSRYFPEVPDGDGVVSHASSSGVIAILFAAARVAPGSLNVSVWIGTNPYFGPRWRHRDRIDAREFRAIGNSGI